MAKLSVGLVHWPVLDRQGGTVATNVTNFDIHDIARASRTYGIEKYFIINKVPEQLMFVSRVLDHWKVGTGYKYNPMRQTALNMVELVETVDQALGQFSDRPLLVATAARDIESTPPVKFRQLRELLVGREQDVLLLFGTGFGLSDEILKKCDYLLEPITGASSDHYRHLSVRSAVSICLDRLLGAW